MKLKNYLLVFGLIVTVAFSSCKKEEDAPPEKEAPKISINATTSGNIITIPEKAISANDGQFNMVISNVNQIGAFLTVLNAVPKDATVISTRSTNSASTYYWTVTQGDATVEYWYTITENGNNYDIVYEFSYTSVDLNIDRNTYMSGSVAKDGKTGHLILNYDAFTNGESAFNYTYNWDTNTAGDLHIIAYWNIEGTTSSNIIYETTIYATGGGVSEYRYSQGDDSIVWHYKWNADWTVITWTYTVNGEEDSDNSGQWTA